MQNIVAPMLGSGIRKEPLFYLYSNRDITSGIYINSYNHTIMDWSNSYIRPGEERYLYIFNRDFMFRGLKHSNNNYGYVMAKFHANYNERCANGLPTNCIYLYPNKLNIYTADEYLYKKIFKKTRKELISKTQDAIPIKDVVIEVYRCKTRFDLMDHMDTEPCATNYDFKNVPVFDGSVMTDISPIYNNVAIDYNDLVYKTNPCLSSWIVSGSYSVSYFGGYLNSDWSKPFNYTPISYPLKAGTYAFFVSDI